MTTERFAVPRPTRTLCFELHPLYATLLTDGGAVREGEVIGLDNDLSHVLVAPFAGSVRLLVTGQGATRRVKAFLTEAITPRPFNAVPLKSEANRYEASRN